MFASIDISILKTRYISRKKISNTYLCMTLYPQGQLCLSPVIYYRGVSEAFDTLMSWKKLLLNYALLVSTSANHNLAKTSPTGKTWNLTQCENGYYFHDYTRRLFVKISHTLKSVVFLHILLHLRYMTECCQVILHNDLLMCCMQKTVGKIIMPYFVMNVSSRHNASVVLDYTCYSRYK